LLAITVAIGWLYFRLGLGLARIKEIGFLLTLSGVATAVVGFGATILGGLMLRGSKGWPAWAQDLGVNLITQFFALGKNMGILLALAGISIWVGTIVLTKQGKLKEKGKKTVSQPVIKTLLKAVVGVTLGVVILVLVSGLLIRLTGGKFNLSVSTSQPTNQAR